jgi:hypothetical protein
LIDETATIDEPNTLVGVDVQVQPFRLVLKWRV